MICPLCAATVELEAQTCPACDLSLSEYAQVHYYPDLLFNDALRRVGRGQYAEACALLAQVCAWRPRDLEAIMLWATAAEGRGDDSESVRILLDALELDSGPAVHAAYNLALARLEDAAGPAQSVLLDLSAQLRDGIGRLEAMLEAGARSVPVPKPEPGAVGRESV
ncbi:MAG: hypothetical protein LBJ02_00755 [Bifidobacteriaceae bacterium]|jgi:hypothetical protein|nr:hypothetical protein [Bifidobacteriaceae bacterium]